MNAQEPRLTYIPSTTQDFERLDYKCRFIRAIISGGM